MSTNETRLKDLIKEELRKCATDPIYFIRRHCYIQEPIRGRIRFDLFDYQIKAIHDFETYQYNIILKGRQIGISTATACYALWLMLFHNDKNILVIATKQDTAKTLITKVRYAYENLPVYCKVPCIENNKLSLKFKNGSQIKASTATEDSGRSEALSLLILDEAAFIKNAKEIWTAANATLSTGGRAVLISTPNGVGNFFHEMYTKAETRESVEADGRDAMLFNAVKLDWRVHPNRDQAWRDQMGKANGERAARQEHDAEFIGSGNTFIDEYLIQWYKETTMKDPIAYGEFDGNLWIWEHPTLSGKYLVTADVARGDGEDYSTFHVIDLDTLTQVAEYRGKIGTTEFGHMLIRAATTYNDAILVVERENMGWSVLQTIIDREYKNLFYMSKDLQVIELHKSMGVKYYSDEEKLVPGFGTTSKTRPLALNKLDIYMKEQEINIRSKRLLNELDTFIWENGKPQAMQGKNDDLVMALAIGLWVRDTALRLAQEGHDVIKKSLENIRRVGSEEGMYVVRNLPYNPYVIPFNGAGGMYGTPNEEDITWLL